MAGRRPQDERWAQHVDEIAHGVKDVARSVGSALGDVGEVMGELAGSFATRRPSAAEILLKKARNKHRQWRGHLRAYAVVVPGIAVLNWVLASAGDVLPFAAIVAVGWGMGLAIHGLSYRSWLGEHGEQLERARLAVHAEQQAAQAERLPELAADPAWQDLVRRTRAEVAATREALQEPPHGMDADDLRLQLDGGLESLESLASGAVGLRRALDAVAPGGSDGIREQLAGIEARISAASDPQLKQVQQANRELLQARLTRVATLNTEAERMKARADGFLLAVQNIRLDASRLAAGAVFDADLAEPVARLAEEVELLRQVEAELADLGD